MLPLIYEADIGFPNENGALIWHKSRKMSSGLWADLIGGSKGSEKISIPSSLGERSWEKIYEDKNCRGVKLYKNPLKLSAFSFNAEKFCLINYHVK